ncbi:MAG: xanthine dehydrogenase accessory protein XdhC [Pseudomonadota bacterium]
MTGIAVTITGVEGSAPRGTGAMIWVTERTTEGSIGGGALEYAMIAAAREMLTKGEERRAIRQPLGPEIGQCCGGRVDLVLERRETPPDNTVMRPHVLIFGAGHVGSALARALAPLPLSLTVVDERRDWLSPLGALARTEHTPLPEAVVAAAPPDAAYVILTHDHALDFLIAEAALRRGDAAYLGMIGSATKRARLVADLTRKGVDPGPLICPIGASTSRDKRPEVIAACVAAELVARLL